MIAKCNVGPCAAMRQERKFEVRKSDMYIEENIRDPGFLSLKCMVVIKSRKLTKLKSALILPSHGHLARWE